MVVPKLWDHVLPFEAVWWFLHLCWDTAYMQCTHLQHTHTYQEREALLTVYSWSDSDWTVPPDQESAASWMWIAGQFCEKKIIMESMKHLPGLESRVLRFFSFLTFICFAISPERNRQMERGKIRHTVPAFFPPCYLTSHLQLYSNSNRPRPVCRQGLSTYFWIYTVHLWGSFCGWNCWLSGLHHIAWLWHLSFINQRHTSHLIEVEYLKTSWLVAVLYHLPACFMSPMRMICGQCCRVLAKKGLVTPRMTDGL